MTAKELSQLTALRQEVKMLDERLISLNNKLLDINNKVKVDCVQGSSKSLPYSLHSIVVSGLSDGECTQKSSIRHDIAEIKNKIRAQKAKCIAEYKKLSDYIATIPDSLTRQIFRLRFLDNKLWSDIAETMGGSNTEDSVRKVVERYLQKN